MMHLENLLQAVKPLQIIGTTNKTVPCICFDSRQVKGNELFVAVKGAHVDGHRFLADVSAKGASIIVCEKLPEQLLETITYIVVENSAKALGLLADWYYGRPSHKMKVVAITGTNGKTTTTTLLYDLFTQLGYKCGLLSTVENRIAGEIYPSTHTTPDAVSIHRMLGEMVDNGCMYAFMEASSHAIHQQRVAGLNLAGAVFTNITHDHLEYHGNFQNYISAKKELFDNLSSEAFALINLDDNKGKVMVQNTQAKVYTYSLQNKANFKGKILDNNIAGLHLSINDKELITKLIGEFNAYNLLAGFGVATLLNQKEEEVLETLSSLNAAEGRFQMVNPGKTEITGIIDYAHTPDALEKVLNTILEMRNDNQKIITVFGCGGDRDKEKRPIMADIATRLSDKVIVTNDNPRTEDPNVILEEINKGVSIIHKKKTLTIADRQQAIKTAVALAGENDVILVAGKGHEKYQEINGVKHPFDDKLVLEEALSEI